jgi:hypothetical protein
MINVNARTLVNNNVSAIPETVLLNKSVLLGLSGCIPKIMLV